MEEYKKDRYMSSTSNSLVSHKCNISDRKKIELTGVNEVNSFDTREILLDTKLGTLLIKGESLHIEILNLDKGTVEVNGKIDAMIYSNKSSTDSTAKGVLSRMFR